MDEATGLGWGPFFERQVDADPLPGTVPGRVVGDGADLFRLWVPGEADPVLAAPAGRLRDDPEAGWPAFGDWVLVRHAGGQGRIERVLRRRTALLRRAAGPGGPQVLAANVDVVLVATACDHEFNLNRLERYLTVVAEARVDPVVLVTKVDQVADPASWVAEARAVAGAAPVLPVSSVTGQGVDALDAVLTPGCTAVLLGSSGVGKSTLVNRLLGHEVQATRDVRQHDSHGRHTTTARALFRLPGGALLLDTPGLRELQPWDAEAGMDAAFGDIQALASGCHFRDCQHDGEPGCAVEAAVQAGNLPARRLANYHKLQRELAHEAAKGDKAEEARRNRDWARIHKQRRRDLKALNRAKRGE